MGTPKCYSDTFPPQKPYWVSICSIIMIELLRALFSWIFAKKPVKTFVKNLKAWFTGCCKDSADEDGIDISQMLFDLFLLISTILGIVTVFLNADYSGSSWHNYLSLCLWITNSCLARNLAVYIPDEEEFAPIGWFAILNSLLVTIFVSIALVPLVVGSAVYIWLPILAGIVGSIVSTIQILRDNRVTRGLLIVTAKILIILYYETLSYYGYLFLHGEHYVDVMTTEFNCRNTVQWWKFTLDKSERLLHMVVSLT